MGRIKGSAGNMTGSKVYDKNVMRAKAFEVSNPNTTAQQTERNFFAEVSQCVSGVSEAELRSLFGVKPKTMSRRNALTKQVSEAYSIDGTSKTLDFSKLLSIGNGEKVYTPIVHVPAEDNAVPLDFTASQLGVSPTSGASIILVVFNDTSKQIQLINTDATVESENLSLDMDSFIELGQEAYVYPTCATDGSNVYLKGFGSFTIKTRAV